MATNSMYPVRESNALSFQQNAQSFQDGWRGLLDKHLEALQTASSEGSQASTGRHQTRGQLLARDRVSLLLDPESPFLELCAFAGHGMKYSSPSASMVAGIGNVCGRACLILAHIPTLSGGAWTEYTVLKQNRVTQIATENNLPLIGLVQSAGVFLPRQFQVFHKGGQIFRDLARRSAGGQPNCTIVFGSSTAGGAYHPAMSDYTIFVQNQAQVFLAGPPLVKMSTGEVVDAETLGGASMHGSATGLADQVATDEFDAIRKARDWVKTLTPPTFNKSPTRQVVPPRYPVEDLLSIVDPLVRKPFDMTEVILRIVDDSRWLDYKPNFGKTLLTVWADIHGHRVGIIANQIPVINAQEAMKGATFIRLCNQQNTPIIFLHNVTGFMVGLKAEQSSIIKYGAQMVSAVSVSTVPHISVIVGASYGAGNYAMCGRAYQPRFLFSWPSGRCSVMGPDQLVGVMDSIGARRAKPGAPRTDAAKAKTSEQLRLEVLRDGNAYRTSGVLLDDGVIDPRDTRDVLGMCLDVVSHSPVRGSPAHHGLARL